ncbi:prophage tail gpP-like protein [Humitalea rosea]|uniref:Prophage tail gpP-like protein n=1 Tax=Humitalea rosea TaxID=990373 RepID=A0A2W7IJH4_9PROT|nr:hypothetical protein [Humitalea rosea]PZW46848.1 prophage tail gpP-like protein [Humitalea rosea]
MSGFASGALAELLVDGRIHRGWKTVKVSHSIECGAAKIDLDLTERWSRSEEPRRLRPGAAFKLLLQGDAVVEGFIDSVGADYDDSTHAVTIAGRERTADLVDGAAVVDGPHEFRNLGLTELVARLARPFGIAVRAETNVGRVFDKFALQPGEAAWEAIERACRQRAVLATGNGLGTLLLTRAGAGGAAAGAIVLGGPDGNVLSASGTFDASGRHNIVVVRGQDAGASTASDGLQYTRPAGSTGPWTIAPGQDTPRTAPQGRQRGEGRAADPALTRWRPQVIIAEAAGDGPTFQQRAEWAVRVAAGKARRVEYTVPGWRGGTGKLWAPNTRVQVADAFLDIEEELLIASVNFVLGDQGSTTVLECTLPDAYALIAEAPKGRRGTSSPLSDGVQSRAAGSNDPWRPVTPPPTPSTP